MVAVLLTLGLSGTASAAPPLGADGTTEPTYDYPSAIRQRVFIPQTAPLVDQDHNGVADKITIDIIRPSEPGANNIPVIIDPSPYFTTLCRGIEGECAADTDNDGLTDKWPLFLDNYFVPRGYAVILGQMNGTGFTSDGCPHHGGPGDIAGEKSIIDWLNGRTAGVDKNGNPVVANWDNGKAAMIGKSYDGTLANGVAATGVSGLTTIVPESAISDWYDYSRSNGIRTSGTNYPTFLNQAITDAARRALCNTAVNNDFSNDAVDGDNTGDRNAFWEDRNYRKNVTNVQASVFAVHGFQDDNVKLSQLWPWWQALKANGVPRKLWLLRSGHTDPFDSRRAVWVDTLHRWFDHWLYDVDNGIMSEPRVTIEDDKDVWGEYGDWPIPGTSDVNVFLQGTTADAAGVLRGTSGGPLDSVTFTGNGTALNGSISSTVETNAMSSPEGAQTSRRVFLSRPLTEDLRLSGRATIDLRAALSTAQSNLGAVLVDYNATPFTEVSRTDSDGLREVAGSARTCWGYSSASDTACYLDVIKPTQNVTQWRVTRGILDSSNRDSLTTPTNVNPGQQYTFTIPLEPTEHTFKAGHRIGVVIVGNLLGTAGTPSSQITVDTKLTKLVLPVAGGDAAARASALTDEVQPTTAASFSPAANASGWTRASSVTLDADDGDGSGAASIAYTLNGTPETATGATTTVPLPDGSDTLIYAATDRAGNVEADQSLTIKVDTHAPVASCPADDTWHADNVTVACTATDADSGITEPAFTLRTSTGPGAEDAQSTATRTVCDVAGNCGAARVTRRIDRRAPAIAFTHPSRTTFARGEVVALTHSCTDGGSGVATCSGRAQLDTAKAGPFTAAVTATDKTGNAASQSWSYKVLGKLAKLGLKTKAGRKITLTSAVPATVRISGGVRALTVKLRAGVARTVTLKPKKKQARKVALKLATTAGALRRTEVRTVTLRR